MADDVDQRGGNQELGVNKMRVLVILMAVMVSGSANAGTTHFYERRVSAPHSMEETESVTADLKAVIFRKLVDDCHDYGMALAHKTGERWEFDLDVLSFKTKTKEISGKVRTAAQMEAVCMIGKAGGRR